MLEDEYQINKKKLNQLINNNLDSLINNLEISKHFRKELNYEGNLVVDGKYIPVKEDVAIDLKDTTGIKPKSKKRRKVLRGKVLIWGCDYFSHDIMHYEFGDYESMFKYNQYFKTLKEINYPLKTITIDDKREIQRACLNNFPNCIVQLCIYHYFQKLNRELKIALVKKRIKAIENRIEKLYRVNSVNNKGYIPYSRKKSIKDVSRLNNKLLELNSKYELLIDFESIIKSIILASNYQEANDKYNYLIKIFWPSKLSMREEFDERQIKLVRKLITDFKRNKEFLINYLKHPQLNIPRTTNLVEGLNSQLEIRLNSIKGFESIKTANNFLNAWIIKRRFTKFTDCKDQFKKLNKKTPLECAGADIRSVKSWLEYFKINSPLGE